MRRVWAVGLEAGTGSLMTGWCWQVDAQLWCGPHGGEKKERDIHALTHTVTHTHTPPFIRYSHAAWYPEMMAVVRLWCLQNGPFQLFQIYNLVY